MRMLDSLYQYFFSSDVMEYKTPKGNKVLIRVGDKVSVFSQRFKQWFPDGIVVATFRDSLKVRYGFQKYFGAAFARGNEKYVHVKDMVDTIRPHRVSFATPSLDRLNLVCPAAADAGAAAASVPGGEADAKS